MVFKATVTELVGDLEMSVKLGGACAGRVPPVPLKVTPAEKANALPSMVLLVSIVMDWSAIMVPLKMENVPRVAEVPTCQKMFLACAPPARMTLIVLPT